MACEPPNSLSSSDSLQKINYINLRNHQFRGTQSANDLKDSLSIVHDSCSTLTRLKAIFGQTHSSSPRIEYLFTLAATNTNCDYETFTHHLREQNAGVGPDIIVSIDRKTSSFGGTPFLDKPIYVYQRNSKENARLPNGVKIVHTVLSKLTRLPMMSLG